MKQKQRGKQGRENREKEKRLGAEADGQEKANKRLQRRDTQEIAYEALKGVQNIQEEAGEFWNV